MKAVDTNVLVYAHREETPQHQAALRLLTELAEGAEPWAIAWPCAYEFLRVVTHPRVFDPPMPIAVALESLESLLDSSSLQMLGEGPAHRAHLRQAVAGGGVTGNLVHDAHIAALLVEHGVQELVSADRDFTRFPQLRVTHPF